MWWKSSWQGWHRVKLHRLVFPPSCAACSGPATTHETLKGGQLNWPLFICTLGLLGNVEEISVYVPMCQDCLRRARWKGRRHGFFVGLVMGALLAALMLAASAKMRVNPFAGTASLLAIGAVCGAIAGGGMSGNVPVRIRKYLRHDRTLMVRLDRPEYEAAFLKAMEEGTANANVPAATVKIQPWSPLG